MDKRKKRRIRRILLALALITVWAIMCIPGAGEVYARRIYPCFLFILSPFSSLFPFSIGDCFIYGSVGGILGYLIYSLAKRKKRSLVLLNLLEYLAWVYVWFYFAWGLNYFRNDFYHRTHIAYVKYTEKSFKHFLTDYTEDLNRSYIPQGSLSREQMQKEIQKLYPPLIQSFHLSPLSSHPSPKPMLFTSLMSGVGVLGYMGPFFLEYHVNGELLPVQYPFTYAHEVSHLLGVSSEAEANLCAYLICTRSEEAYIRFSGYLSLLPYVLANAQSVLSENEFKEWVTTISPEIKMIYREKVAYWQAKYSPLIGRIQDALYNSFLKSNNIPSGQQNYSEVVGMLIAYQSLK